MSKLFPAVDELNLISGGGELSSRILLAIAPTPIRMFWPEIVDFSTNEVR